VCCRASPQTPMSISFEVSIPWLAPDIVDDVRHDEATDSSYVSNSVTDERDYYYSLWIISDGAVEVSTHRWSSQGRGWLFGIQGLFRSLVGEI
jgi:hypothetical protein